MPRKKIAPQDGLVQVASVEGTSGADVKELMAQIEGLREKLAIETKARTEAEKLALAAVQSADAGSMQAAPAERATGKMIEVQKLSHYDTVGHKEDGRPILKPVFKKVKVPTFFYRVDIPPVGGMSLTINGVPLMHNTVYELDQDSLSSVKDMVWKCWKHDLDIHGSDENAYRKPTQAVFSGRAGGRVS